MSPTEINRLLYARYGELHWWPARTPYEVMIGAVLTQNTAWGNVEKAIGRFGESPTPELVETMASDVLIEIIRPAGFFNQKARYLKELTAWFKRYGYSIENARKQKLVTLRHELLSVRGVGKETADSILLYALELPTFVVDAYTNRLLSRLGIADVTGYDGIKAYFEDGLPKDTALYNNLHAMIVINAKEHCKTKAKCEGCPLQGNCEA